MNGTRANIGSLLLAGLLSCAAGNVSAADEFKVCLAAEQPPYSMRAGNRGFDYEVAARVAGVLGRRYLAVWHDNATTIQEIEENDFPTRRLARGECDAIFSMPGPASDSLAGESVLTLGAAYYGAAFELVSCSGEFPALPADWRGHRLAIQSQTVAHFAARAVAAETRNYFSPEAVLAAVIDGTTEAGLVWGPTVGWLLQQTNAIPATHCALVKDYVAPSALRWNMHVATRAADQDLRLRIDQALATLRASGELAAMAGRYGVPLHGVFAETYSRAAMAALVGHTKDHGP